MGGRDKIQQRTQRGDGFLPSLLSSLTTKLMDPLFPLARYPWHVLTGELSLTYKYPPSAYHRGDTSAYLGYLLIVGNTRTVPRPVLEQKQILMS